MGWHGTCSACVPMVWLWGVASKGWAARPRVLGWAAGAGVGILVEEKLELAVRVAVRLLRLLLAL